MYHSGDNIGAIVADIGSYATRIGFAGEDSPRAYFPTTVGVIGDRDPSHNTTRYQFSTHKYSPGVHMESAVTEGIITDWDLYEKTWEYAMQNYVKTDISGSPVLIAEKPFNPFESRHKLCEMMFETYNASAFFLTKDATLACYACGKTSGMVIDCGASGTLVSPVLDGWVEMKGVLQSSVGGRVMDAFMLQLLTKRLHNMKPRPLYKLQKSASDMPGMSFVSELVFSEPVHASFDAYALLELAKDVRESVCLCAEAPLSQIEAKLSLLPTTPYELPDGTVVDAALERYQVCELFFDRTVAHSGSSSSSATLFSSPELDALMHSSAAHRAASATTIMPSSSEPLPQIVLNSMFRSELEGSPSALWGNIILTGGNSCYRGLLDRIKSELEVKSGGNKVRVFAASEVERLDKADKMKSVIDRAICPWLGGSIMGSLGSFHEMWVSKKEYEEHGAHIVDVKCP